MIDARKNTRASRRVKPGSPTTILRHWDYAISGTFPLSPVVFQLDPQSLCHAVDEVVVRRHLTHIVDFVIRQARLSDGRYVRLSHAARIERQLHGIVGDGPFSSGQVRLRVVVFDCCDLGIVPDPSTEARSVMPQSVEAVVGTRHHHRDHFSLGA